MIVEIIYANHSVDVSAIDVMDALEGHDRPTPEDVRSACLCAIEQSLVLEPGSWNARTNELEVAVLRLLAARLVAEENAS